MKYQVVCEQCGLACLKERSSQKQPPRFCSTKCSAIDRGNRIRGTTDRAPYTMRDGVHEHRTIMESKLGRKLAPGEIVHHDDRDTRNNEPENLILKASRGDHTRDHMIVDNWNAILTNDEVRKILVLLKAGQLFQREIGAMFGVTQQTVSDIACGRYWKHIER